MKIILPLFLGAALFPSQLAGASNSLADDKTSPFQVFGLEFPSTQMLTGERDLHHTIPPVITPWRCNYDYTHDWDAGVLADEIYCPNWCGVGKHFTLTVTSTLGENGDATTVADCRLPGCSADGCSDKLGSCTCPEGVTNFRDVCDSMCFKETDSPTPSPTPEPSAGPTKGPTASPTAEPTAEPTSLPTVEPTSSPTVQPTKVPTSTPTAQPTPQPTVAHSSQPSPAPTPAPSARHSSQPSPVPTKSPTISPSETKTTLTPTQSPTESVPTLRPNLRLTFAPATFGAGEQEEEDPTVSLSDLREFFMWLWGAISARFGGAALPPPSDGPF